MFGFWRELASRYVAAVCARGDDTAAEVPPPDDAALAALAAAAPPMPGGEYVDAALLAALWRGLDRAFRAAVRDHGGGVAGFLGARNAAWNLVGRVHFNLAENRGDDEAPFAFLATYTTRLSAQGKAQHLPLGQALREYARRARSRARLLSLLLPVQRAAETCAWLEPRWSTRARSTTRCAGPPAEAFRLLGDVAAARGGRRRRARAGGVARAAAAARRRSRVTVGGKPPAGLGADALLDFQRRRHARRRAADRPARCRSCSPAPTACACVRGRWVELDRDTPARGARRSSARVERRRRPAGSSFAEAMRLLAGAPRSDGEAARRGGAGLGAASSPGRGWPRRSQALRQPEGLARGRPRRRPAGARCGRTSRRACAGCTCCRSCGLGACLADDMGLGKTIQVLALLLVLRRTRAPGAPAPSLLVVPASLLGNWAAEIARFAPDLRVLVAHPSAMPARGAAALAAARARRRRSRDHQLRHAARARRGSTRRRGASSSSTRRRRSRTRARGRRGR